MSRLRRLLRLPLLVAALALLPTTPAFAIGKVLAFGDSMTFGRGDPEGRGYPPRLQAHLRQNGHPDANVIKSGEGGETSAQGLNRLPGSIPGDTEIAVLMEGTNDLFLGISVETTTSNMLKMAQIVKNNGAEPVLVTIPPFWFRASVNRDNARTILYVNRLREEAVRANIGVVDVFDAYWTNPDRNFDLYDTRFRDDIGHPNVPGYELIAQLIGDQLAEIDHQPPAVGLTTPSDGATGVGRGANLNVKLWDFGTGVDAAASSILIDGEEVRTFRSESGTRVAVAHNPDGPWSGVVKVDVVTQDLAEAPNQVERFAMQFVIAGTTFFRGDLDDNGRVDGRDLAQMAFSFGTSSGDTDFRTRADLDNNGQVNGEDLAILANNFGKISE